MLITISNCNNINSGKIEIRPKFLNVKYGINGTGKSTIAKSIRAFVEKKDELIESLKPYGSDDSVKPMVGGLNSFRNVYTFNEDFVNQFVYKEDDLLENSFEIFVKNPKYEANVSHIKKMLHGISSLFVESSTLSTLMQNLNKFAEGCGNSQNSISAASAIYKGFNYINKINNVPSDLKIFSSFLEDSKDGNNVFWLKWHCQLPIFVSFPIIRTVHN